MSKYDNETFWKSLKDIRTILNKLQISDFVRTIDLLADENVVNITGVALPSGNLTIDICHTFSVNRNIDLKQIILEYSAEVNIYIHYPNQFLSTWRDEKNMVSTSTPLVINNDNPTQTLLHDMNVDFLMEHFYGIETSHRNYDDCVKDIRIDLNHTMKDFILKETKSQFWGKLSLNQDKNKMIYNTLSYADENCKDSQNYLNA